MILSYDLIIEPIAKIYVADYDKILNNGIEKLADTAG